MLIKGLIKQWIVNIIMWNRGKPWYKFYIYYRIRSNIDKHGGIIESAYGCNYLYKWQYKKLLRRRLKTV